MQGASYKDQRRFDEKSKSPKAVGSYSPQKGQSIHLNELEKLDLDAEIPEVKIVPSRWEKSGFRYVF